MHNLVIPLVATVSCSQKGQKTFRSENRGLRPVNTLLSIKNSENFPVCRNASRQVDINSFAPNPLLGHAIESEEDPILGRGVQGDRSYLLQNTFDNEQVVLEF